MIEKEPEEPEKSKIRRRDFLKMIVVAPLLMPSVLSATENKVETIKLGDTNVKVVVYQKGISAYTFLNIHDNENTAVTVARKFIDEQGGRLVELQHTGDRFISFHVNGQKYSIDPNRIFSEVGIRKNLTDLNKSYSEEAFNEVTTFAQNFLARFVLSSTNRIVAVHNNTEGNMQIKSFGAEASQIHVQQGTDPDDFFLVTDQNDFRRLRGKMFNVVLQSLEKVTDDGSLSVLCGKRGIPYINVEAQHGHEDEQLRMLNAL